jgi:hypothetical protein
MISSACRERRLGADGYAQRLDLAAVCCLGPPFEVAERKEIGVQGVSEHVLGFLMRTACRDDSRQLVDRGLYPVVLHSLEPRSEGQCLHHASKSRAIGGMIAYFARWQTTLASRTGELAGLLPPTIAQSAL